MDCPGRWKADKCTVSNSVPFIARVSALIPNAYRILVQLLRLRYHPNQQQAKAHLPPLGAHVQ